MGVKTGEQFSLFNNHSVYPIRSLSESLFEIQQFGEGQCY